MILDYYLWTKNLFQKKKKKVQKKVTVRLIYSDFDASNKKLHSLISQAAALTLKDAGGGAKVPADQEIVCHFSQGYAMVTNILDFIHKHVY